ncbi:response regulator receiver modulated diguanylate cyclase [Mariprofundus ferrinatatus]|uniref:diguanylate cyclase n=1 Tax=Mariprofundus ferrinatatus TaxID=1921087 RepID=A0A2K8L6F8_9PROT|nr:response regulator receiver modulated diguanylate cyclase [Mariprofundus ferrinatatus]
MSSDIDNSAPVGMRQSHSIMVLLVDDQPIIAETLRRMLDGESDIDFHYCLDAGEALDMAAAIHPTLILQDLIMPRVDGLDLVREYRRHPECREIPIIVLSAREDPKVKAEAFARGANDYVVKLPDRVELLARIRYHSQWYIHKRQRDEAYRSLQESQRQMENMNLKLMHLSTHDSLTNIPNRYHFDQMFSGEWSRSGRDSTPLSIVMIDIDEFKKYNDALGHPAGDKCLAAVANVLSNNLHRPADLVARYGGEEFVLLLPGTDAAGAKVIAEKMASEIEKLKVPHPDSSVSDHITISLGVAATIADRTGRPDSLLHDADEALYAAKKAGRNQIRVAGE